MSTLRIGAQTWCRQYSLVVHGLPRAPKRAHRQAAQTTTYHLGRPRPQNWERGPADTNTEADDAEESKH